MQTKFARVRRKVLVIKLDPQRFREIYAPAVKLAMKTQGKSFALPFHCKFNQTSYLNILTVFRFTLALVTYQRWQRIRIGPGSYCYFADPDPVSLENAHPDLIFVIIFKLIVDVCQNIR